MPLTDNARSVIERPLPQEKIKQRPGKGGLTFDYVTPDFIIKLLNEAFEYRWSTSVFHQSMYGDTAVVGLNLTVWDAEGNPITKSQFGACDMGRGMGAGEAFKGAASDAMKKSATLLGVALELYNDDEAPKQQFQRPQIPNKPAAPPAPPSPAAKPHVPGAVPTVPKPVAPPVVSSTRPDAGPPRHTTTPPKKANPFANGGHQGAAVPKPAAPPAPPKPVSAPKSNPFASKVGGSGPNPTQLNALTNLSQRKGLSQSDMISLAGVMDETGNPKQTFEELTHAEAIQVIKASQL
jgi:hypothetical protein